MFYMVGHVLGSVELHTCYQNSTFLSTGNTMVIARRLKSLVTEVFRILEDDQDARHVHFINLVCLFLYTYCFLNKDKNTELLVNFTLQFTVLYCTCCTTILVLVIYNTIDIWHINNILWLYENGAYKYLSRYSYIIIIIMHIIIRIIIISIIICNYINQTTSLWLYTIVVQLQNIIYISSLYCIIYY